MSSSETASLKGFSESVAFDMDHRRGGEMSKELGMEIDEIAGIRSEGGNLDGILTTGEEHPITYRNWFGSALCAWL